VGFDHLSTSPPSRSERKLYRCVSKCEELLRNLSNEEIEEIVLRSVGSKNMSKLTKMIRFLELKEGNSIAERFTKNIVLLSLLYGARRSSKSLTFTDLVFQALYAALSTSGSRSKKLL